MDFVGVSFYSFPLLWILRDLVFCNLGDFNVLSAISKTPASGFSRFSNARPQAEWFYCFRAFGNLMKPEAQFFKMTSPKQQYKIMQFCIFPIFLQNALYV